MRKKCFCLSNPKKYYKFGIIIVFTHAFFSVILYQKAVLGDVKMIFANIKNAEKYYCLHPGDSYFPTSSAYDEGGYEAKTSRLKKGGDKIIIDGMKKLLSQI